MTFLYGSGPLPLKVIDTAGREIALAYNGSGNLVSATLPDGRAVSYSYTGGHLSKVTDVRRGTTAYTYDAQGRLATITDANGKRVIFNIYGNDGRVVAQKDHLGRTTTFDWNPATQTSFMTNPRGYTWKDVYASNVLVQERSPDEQTTSYEYDAQLNLIGITDRSGGVTRMEYDGNGDITSRIAPAPLAYEESFSYDPQGRLSAYIDGGGRGTLFAYDSDGNLITAVKPGNRIFQYTYDSSGLLTTSTNPLSNVTSYSYDSDGNLVEVVFPSGRRTRTEYDASGRAIARIDRRGLEAGADKTRYTWHFSYDDANNLLSQTDPLGGKTSWTYDAAGNVKAETDTKGRSTHYSYDFANRVSEVSAPAAGVTAYFYDSVGNLTRRTDANGHSTTYNYDSGNRLQQTHYPDGRIYAYGYDRSGRMNEISYPEKDALGQSSWSVTGIKRDVIGRVARIEYRGPSGETVSSVRHTYDGSGNRLFMTDDLGTEAYTYDDAGYLTGVTRDGRSFGYSLDPGGNILERTYPDGTKSSYSYDADGRISTVDTAGGQSSYSYDAAGNETALHLPSPSGYKTTRTFDRAGRVIEVANVKGGEVLSRFNYDLDAAGNPVRVETEDGATYYEYDGQDRLLKACYVQDCATSTDFIAYSYDAVGNRLMEIRPTGETAYEYDEADKLIAVRGPLGVSNYSYDGRGNVTQAGLDTFSYNSANLLEAATVAGLRTVYSYDGDGKRVGQSSGSETSASTRYEWDIANDLPLLVSTVPPTAHHRTNFRYGNDLLAQDSTVTGTTFYHHDGLGSVTDVTGADGSHKWAYSYEPFGTSRTALKLDPLAPDNPMRFTGEYLDATGLYHLRARQYDPRIGRFTATDPLPAGPYDPHVSTYAYVNNRPTLFVDPSGLFCVLGTNAHDGSCRGSGVLGGVGGVMWGAGQAANDAAGAALGGLADATGGTPTNCGSATCVTGSWLVPPGAEAWAVGHTIIGRGDVSGCLLEHELTHVRQYEDSGIFFVPIYAWDTAFNGYEGNIYETEAYAVQSGCRAEMALGQHTK